MASRPSWEGFLKFNLISVPVKAYNAAAGGGKIGFHLLHRKCNSRIRYKKVCPIHGEVPNDEIVSGYEVAKDQYAIVERDERGELRTEDDKAITVDAFVEPEAVDPVYYSGRTYYLVPDGKVAQKPYVVLFDAMSARHRFAVAQVVFAGRAQVALVRPAQGILALTLLVYETEIKSPAAFAAEVEKPDVSAAERKLAETLIDASTVGEFDLGQYKDEYAGKLAKLIAGKAKTRKRAPARGEEPAVINLMDALRQSLNRARKESAGTKRGGTRATGKRKTG
jgi:DNA end-binding protein Ku